ncbi:Protein of unknown function [Pyronema omphalodes CBS 100304]|uniref:Uncharacterized protein n=1 Tax=Pyronema omphalodes (strain CBS 100304) TaxID=1076935 RepID=U4LK83_PYROM|nr:Protein of unknown function [Pyronema omphalodes CBS 100304]
MQRCFLPTCQDLGPGCVCRLLVTAPETSRTCTISECSPKGEYNAFSDVWNECLSRKDELGIGELPVLPSLTTPIPTLATQTRELAAPEQTPDPSGTETTTTTVPPTIFSSTHTSNHDGTATPDVPNGSSTHRSNHGSTSSSSPRGSSSSSMNPQIATSEAQTTTRGTSSSTLAVSITVPTISLFLLGAGLFFFIRRRRQKSMARLSIDTFMDTSDANNPQIGAPLDVRHEKLPAFLNDLLQNEPPPPIRAARRPSIPKTELAPSIPPAPVDDEDPFKDQYFVVAPVDEEGGQDALSIYPAPAAPRRVPAIPASPKPTFSRSTSKASKSVGRASVLSAISEASSGGSPNTSSAKKEVVRVAYPSLQRAQSARTTGKGGGLNPPEDEGSDWTSVVGLDDYAATIRGSRITTPQPIMEQQGSPPPAPRSETFTRDATGGVI